MFARKFSSDGSSVWPAPWRARKATRFPRSVPTRYGPDGSPNGVATFRSLRSVSSAMSYSPLPPMIPMSIPMLPCWLILAFPFVLSHVCRRDGRIVLEEDERFFLGDVLEERFLRGQPVHGIVVGAQC